MKSITKQKKITMAILLCLVAAGGLFANTAYIQAKAILAQYLIAHAWEETLQQSGVGEQHIVRPWAWADTYPVVKLSLPKHAIEQYVLAGASGSPLAFGPGLYAGTQLPSGSAATLPDAVIAGHHNTHFSFLKSLVIGDSLTLQTRQGHHVTYQVQRIDTYDSRSQRLPSYYGGSTLQLVTCLPGFVGQANPPLRLVVTAKRLNQPPNNTSNDKSLTQLMSVL